MTPIRHPTDISANHGAVPIRCFTNETLLPDRRATDQLMRLAPMRGLTNYVAVLPDMHFKSRNPTPTGTVAVTRDVIVPRAIDEGINCGMRMIGTPLEARDLTAAVLLGAGQKARSRCAAPVKKQHQLSRTTLGGSFHGRVSCMPEVA